MRKKILLLIILFISTTWVIKAQNLYVAPGGSDTTDCSDDTAPCLTISYALGQADPGDIINLEPGEYTESIGISKNITIQGTNASDTFIQANENRGVADERVIGIFIETTEVILNNVTIRHGNDLVVGGVGGGGIYNQGILTLTNSVVQDNNSAASGGGISGDDDSEITLNNSAVLGNSTGNDGGGIWSLGTVTIQNNSTLVDNNSGNNGGGIYLSESGSIDDSLIQLNNGQTGGGIYHAFSAGLLTITNSVIDDNSSTGSTAGILTLSPINITDSHITNNRDFGSGAGGIFITNTAMIANTVISGNESSNSGGGIRVTGSLTLTGSLVSGNKATNGGGIYHDGGSSTITNVTITGNDVEFNGGGLFNTDFASPVLKNVILWGNRAGASGNQIHNTATGINLPGISYSLIEGSGGSSAWDGNLGSDDGDNIDEDPEFITPIAAASAPDDGGDYTTGPTSPVINAGETPADLSIFSGGPGAPVDLAGNPRVDGAAIDMGAYEFEGDPVEFDPFITTWKTDNPGTSADNQITIPVIDGGYDFTVHWGDGNSTDWEDGDPVDGLTHTYDPAGTYTVEITGDFPRIYFNNEGDREKILSVDQWGDIVWSTMGNSFWGATNLEVHATDAPDLDNVTSTMSMFQGASSFNQDISGWDVSNVENMTTMFFGAASFDQNLGGWDISGVEGMSGMLSNTGLSTANYDATLTGWAAQAVQSNISLGAEGLEYCAEAEHEVLTGAPNNWVITGDALAAGCGLVCPVTAGGTLFVKSGDAGDGTSWADALGELRDALELLESGTCTAADVDEIWVSTGIYTPTDDPTDRDSSFRLYNGVSILGGFDGTEEAIDEKDHITNPTYLSGNITGIAGGPQFDLGDLGDFSYTVVDASGTDETAVLDGFFITAGHANDGAGPGETARSSGAGIYNNAGSPVLQNLYILGNRATAGAAGILNSSGASPLMKSVVITENEGGYGGGIVNDSNSSPVIIGSLIARNTALFRGGGMINSDGSTPVLYSVYIFDNHALDGVGGGVWNRGADVDFVNVTIINNTSSDDGGGIHNESELSLTNSIVWANEAGGNGDQIFTHEFSTSNLLYSVYQNDPDDIAGAGTFTADGNTFTDDPLFIDPDNDDARLTIGSPAMFTGDPDAVPDFADVDVTQNARKIDGNIDRGAFQSPGFIIGVSPANQTAQLGQDYLPLEISLQARTDTGYEGAIWPVVGNVDVNYPAAGATVSFAGDPGNPFILPVTSSETTPVPTATGDLGPFQIEFSTNGATTVFADMENLSPMEFDDQRVLASNRQNYVFTGTDFGLSDPAFSIKIEFLATQGELQNSGVAVSVDDILSVDDINSGNLAWAHTFNDQHGVRFSEFAYRVIDDGGTESPALNEMHIDLAAVSVDLVHNGEGWRYMTSPAIGETFTSLLGPIYTQGIPGSNNPGAAFPNVYRIDQANYQWEVPGHMDEEIGMGEAFIVYLFSDDDGDGTPDGFPKTLLSGETWLELADGFEFTGLDYDPDPAGANPDNFYLIGNPHPVSLDFCQMLIFLASEMSPSAHFWDPSANGGNGDYISGTCAIPPAIHIAPFQAFWVRTGNVNPELSTGFYLETMEDGFFKEQPKSLQSGIANLNGDQENPFGDVIHASFEVAGEDGVFTNQAHLLFSDEGTHGVDHFDVPKLDASGLAQRWISLHTLDDSGKPYAFRSLPSEVLTKDDLPADFGDQITIPMDIRTTEAGMFELTWELPPSSVFNRSYWLRDNHSGQVIELKEGQSYRFEVNHSNAVSSNDTPLIRGDSNSPLSRGAGGVLSPSLINQTNQQTEPRFELLVASAGVDGLASLGDLPDNVSLAQNYPNPFNPSTIIHFELPEQGQVRLDVFDMVGRRVATLIDGSPMQAGRHQVNFDASNLTSGVYIYRLQSGGSVLSRKLTLIK